MTGKTLIACGDSITAATNLSGTGGVLKSYAQLAAEKHGMTFERNTKSGSTMAYNAGGKENISIYAFSNTRYKNLPAFDYLTLWFGWNDGAYSELGTIDDTDNTTFYGAYKIVLDYLTTHYPNAKIGLIVPYANSAYSQAVREVAELYNIPYLDVTDFDRESYTYDGCHPHQEGHNYLSTLYEQFLLSL